MFAARCVLELPLAVGSDPRHFNLGPVEGSATTGTGVLSSICYQFSSTLHSKSKQKWQYICDLPKICCTLEAP